MENSCSGSGPLLPDAGGLNLGQACSVHFGPDNRHKAREERGEKRPTLAKSMGERERRERERKRGKKREREREYRVSFFLLRPHFMHTLRGKKKRMQKSLHLTYTREMQCNAMLARKMASCLPSLAWTVSMRTRVTSRVHGMDNCSHDKWCDLSLSWDSANAYSCRSCCFCFPFTGSFSLN